MSSDESTRILLAIPITLVLLSSALAPAWLVWAVAPPVGGEFAFYIRLAAAALAGINGVFVGGYILRTALEITADFGNSPTRDE